MSPCLQTFFSHTFPQAEAEARKAEADLKRISEEVAAQEAKEQAVKAQAEAEVARQEQERALMEAIEAREAELKVRCDNNKNNSDTVLILLMCMFVGGRGVVDKPFSHKVFVTHNLHGCFLNITLTTGAARG